MTRVTTFAAGSFGAFLQSKGIPDLSAVPALYVTMARRLSSRPREVAPNSPILAAFAKELGEPLPVIQAFATGAPLAPRWLKKIESQVRNGTIPRGDKVWRRTVARPARTKASRSPVAAAAPHRRSGRGHGHGAPLTSFLFERTGLSAEALAKQLGLSRSTMGRLCVGQFGGNHPLIPQLAQAIGVEVKTIVKFMHGPRLKASQVAVALARSKPLKALAATAPGTAIVHVPKTAKEARAVEPKRKYNKLRSTELVLRESARMMVTTLNVAIMRGDSHMPPLPLRELHMVLEDYLNAKGVRGNALVSPDFATLFDPK